VESDTKIKEENISNIFTKIAGQYDIINSLISFNQHRKWFHFAVSQMDLKFGQKALDVCCGTGVFAMEMAKEVGANGQIVGLDFCENMLKVAQNKIDRGKHSSISLIKGNAMNLPFEDNQFDGAAIGFALRNVASIDKVLSEMCRVVKPGGTAAILDLAKPTTPLFKDVFYLYFNYIVPVIGRIGVGYSGLYDWLPASLKDYPSPLQIKEKLLNAGFSNVYVYTLSLGIITVHIGKK